MARRAATKSKPRTASKSRRTTKSSTTRRKTASRSAASRKSTARKTASRRSAGRPTARRRSARFGMTITPALAKLARQMSTAMSEMMASPTDAITLLKRDHREVETMFKEFEQLESKAEKGKLAAKICLMLTVHATIEEELLYPQAHEEIEEDLVDEAIVEHASAKQLIAEIEAMSPRDHLFDAKVKVLGEYVQHHVKEEENEMFPQLRDSDIDLEELGEQLMMRKAELLEKMSSAKR
ncbi:MAG TPA: hemerythrin domain-containing protein [Ferrovibrio sp.]|uniref:hemerythrin domain-containing protein n=1 Tax=Ferrovibrio sp. TaxID=1917215 RepID=UPI002B4B7CB4|nr:hemerythrin domain-containing protein [Ferrovibrio sp.]HLT77159.1 hemerythrin domain-containing protein [Ferrovibrio sp.]